MMRPEWRDGTGAEGPVLIPRKLIRWVGYPVLFAVMMISLIAGPFLNASEFSQDDSVTILESVLQMLDEFRSWVGGTALSALVALLVFDRWKVVEERAKHYEDELARSKRITHYVHLAVMDLRLSISSLIGIVSQVAYELREHMEPPDTAAINSLDSPSKEEEVPEALRRMAYVIQKLRREYYEAVNFGSGPNQFVRYSAAHLSVWPEKCKGVAGVKEFVRDAKDKEDRISLAALRCVELIEELHRVVGRSDGPLDLLLGSAAGYRLLSRRWAKTSGSVDLDLDREAPGWGLCSAFDDYWEYMEVMVLETSYLYDAATTIKNLYPIDTISPDPDGSAK